MKFLFKLILLVIILIVLAVLFAPNLISTKAGKELLFKIYKSMTGTTLAADKLNLSWWQGQTIDNFRLEKGNNIFESQKIKTDSALWRILFFHNLGTLEISEPKAIVETSLLVAEEIEKPVLKQAGFIPCSLGKSQFFGHIIADKGEALFQSPGCDPIVLNQVDLDVCLLKSQIKAKAAGRTVGGHFELSMTCLPDQMEILANLENFPIRPFDQIVALSKPKFQGLFLDAIGDTLDIQFQLRNLPSILEVFCDAKSSRFSAHIETKTSNGRVTLASPASIKFQVPSALLHAQNDFYGMLQIDQFSLPLDDKEAFAFHAHLKGDCLQFPLGNIQPFTLFLTTENFKKRDFILKIDSNQIHFNASLHLPDDWKNLQINAKGMALGDTHFDIAATAISQITATVQGPVLQGSFEGGYDPGQKSIFSSKKNSIHYLVTDLPSPFPPLQLHLQLDPFLVTLPNLQGMISTDVRIDPFVLQGIPFGETQGFVKADLQKEKGDFDLATTISQGTLKVVGEWAKPCNLLGKVNFSDIPLSVIDTIWHQPISLILGETLSGTCNFSNLESKRALDFNISNDHFSANGSLEQCQGAFTLTKPASFSLTLTPEAYVAIVRCMNPTLSPFSLTEPVTIKGKIPYFRVPLTQTWDVSNFCYDADLSVDRLSFMGKTQNTSLHELKLHSKHNTPQSPYIFKFATRGQPDGCARVRASFDFTAGCADFSGELQQFPTEAFDVIFPNPISFVTLLGPQVNLTSSASFTNWSGPLKFQLSSQNIRSSLDGNLTDGTLSLNDKLHLQMNLTDDLGKLLLKYFNPLSLTSVVSEGALTLEIPPNGFSYPIIPFENDRVNIPSGRLELGKIYCHNEGNINLTLGLLKRSEFSKNQNLELWFAPLDFHIHQGLLDCERTEILIAREYQICSWGKVDFVSDEVDMILGLTASCLRKAFGIKNLPDTYVLQIPMRGTLNNVKINRSAGTTKIGALLLWQQKAVQESLGKSKAGSIFGELMKKIGPLPDINSKAPPPKHPFPWEKPEAKQTSFDTRKKWIYSEEKPLKQALKVVH